MSPKNKKKLNIQRKKLDNLDNALLKMQDRFHETYPKVALRYMLHFNHPDELLQNNLDSDCNFTVCWSDCVAAGTSVSS